MSLSLFRKKEVALAPPIELMRHMLFMQEKQTIMVAKNATSVQFRMTDKGWPLVEVYISPSVSPPNDVMDRKPVTFFIHRNSTDAASNQVFLGEFHLKGFTKYPAIEVWDTLFIYMEDHPIT